MLENIWTEYVKEQLADRLRGYTPPDHLYRPLPDRWVAMSLLQKAIRRGDERQALRAGSFLLNVDYRSFWRRLVVIAWEDISFGDFDLCGMVTAAAGSKHWRAKLGGEWQVAAYLISALCHAQKNRIADDLLTIIEHEASLEPIRHNLGTATTTELQEQVTSREQSLYSRTIAAWYLLGTDKYGSDALYRRTGDIGLFFETFDTALCPEHVLAICRIAVSRSGTLLPALIPLLWSAWRGISEPTHSITDNLTKSPLLRSVPQYAFDGNTRMGRRYLQWVSEQSSELSQYLAEVISYPDRKALLRKLYFRSYSSLCSERQVWFVSDKARSHADQVGFGLTPQTIDQGKHILSTALRSYPMTEAKL